MTLLDKLVAIRSKEPALLEAIRDLARKDTYHSVLQQIEAWDSVPAGPPESADAAAVWEALQGSPSLLTLLKADPVLSAPDRQDVIIRAGFADVAPDPLLMFRTCDTVFMRLLDLSKSGATSIANILDKLVLDDFSQVALLERLFPTLAAKLCNIAKKRHWASVMTDVERVLDGETPGEMSADAAELAKAVTDEPVSTDGTSPFAIFVTAPRFSSMTPEEVLAYHSIQPALPAQKKGMDPSFRPSPVDEARILAGQAWQTLPESEKARIAKSYTLRWDCLTELKKLRAFVKEDALEHCWPELSDLWRRDRSSFQRFESRMLQPDSCTKEELDHLKVYLADERLRGLLKLQPYFRDLLGTPTAATAPAILPPAAEAARPPAAGAAQPGVVGTSLVYGMQSGLVGTPLLEYKDAAIQLEPTPTPDTYVVKLTIDGKIVESSKAIPFPWSNIRDQVNALRFTRDLPTLSNPPMQAVRELAPPPPRDFATQLKMLGMELVYDRLFPKDEPDLRKAFLEMLMGTQNVRLNWEGARDTPMSNVVPWECLYVPTAPVNFLALTRKYSLTRRNSLAATEKVQPIGGTLRILFTSARPEGLPPLPFVELESQILSQVVHRHSVELRMLPHATLEELHETLREFRPHVFHFSGHGVYRDGQKQGELVLEQHAGPSQEAGPRLLAADRLAVLLHDNDVLLAVLNACDTGISSTNDAVSSVAGALVHTGVPAVVATMRVVVDEAAMLFTREFYRSFLAGFTVEGAMAEARKILNSEYWDWSAYALFVGSADLNALRVIVPVRSNAAAT